MPKSRIFLIVTPSFFGQPLRIIDLRGIIGLLQLADKAINASHFS